jgi:hypothetical protein
MMSVLERWNAVGDPTAGAVVDAERSFNRFRVLAGGLGLLLPVWLLVGDRIFLASEATVRGSLSAYYHSGMRDTFVGILVATGVCLIAYRLTDQGDVRNGISTFAGLMAIIVANFPTSIPKELKEDVESVRPTPLQEYWGEGLVAGIHAAAAFLLIGALCVISIIFWRREKARQATLPPNGEVHPLDRFGSTVHLVCVVLMLASCAWIGINFAFEWLSSGPLQEDFLLYGEWGAIWGFAISFLVQGAIHARRTRAPAPV